jgi:putative phosphoesterase
MRIAIISDIHGNLTALEAVLADLRKRSPDLVVQGGDLPYGGCNPVEVVDRVAELGWPGIVGNTDEVLWSDEGLNHMRATVPKLAPLMRIIEQCAQATRKMLGASRIEKLRKLPAEFRHEDLALVHASPSDLWKSPMDNADDETMEQVYGTLLARTVVYCHIHRPFVRKLRGFTLCNSGSVGMPYDGDPRASYLLMDGNSASIQRVQYDTDQEAKRLLASDYPYKEWLAEIRRRGEYVSPPELATESR